jgi:hypothetical protein
VFPCHPVTKQPLVKSDIAGEGSLKLATTDEATIRTWWKQWPQAMIGLPTGRPIGAFVVDVDAGEDKTTGEIFEASALQLNLEKAIGTKLAPTKFSRTPRGGLHLYYRMPVENDIGNRVEKSLMASITANAHDFFAACETGKGWDVCKTYCAPNATFAAQAEPLAGIKSLAEYMDWMKGLMTIMPDGSILVPVVRVNRPARRRLQTRST